MDENAEKSGTIGWEAAPRAPIATPTKTTARWLDRLNSDAAASPREGMVETLTGILLGVPELLRRADDGPKGDGRGSETQKRTNDRRHDHFPCVFSAPRCLCGSYAASKANRHMSQWLTALDRLCSWKQT
jgi:hypothetical protein